MLVFLGPLLVLIAALIAIFLFGAILLNVVRIVFAIGRAIVVGLFRFIAWTLHWNVRAKRENAG